jgi:hypothetical protein
MVCKSYNPSKNINFFTEDAETIISINPETDTCEYFVTVTARCGCCGESDFRETTLTQMLEWMSEDDFNEFIRHLQ